MKRTWNGFFPVGLCSGLLVVTGTLPLSRFAVAQSAAKPGRVLKAPQLIDVTVSEGTSMSVAVSPDGKTLAIDMQGSIWTLLAAGGTGSGPAKVR